MEREIRPIADHPVLKMEGRKRILCAGDLHIGVEAEMGSKGVHVPSQTHRMEEELLALREYGDMLVLLGDVKHQVPLSSSQEYMEIPRFMRKMSIAFDSVELARGNHDGGLEDFLPRSVNLHPSTGFSIDGVGFIHGHTWPSKSVMAGRTLVMAHNHPALMFIDALGKISLERCWLRCRFSDRVREFYSKVPEELIIIPALNRTLGGSPINEEGKKLLGPLLSKGLVDTADARVYLMDGIYMGRLRDLMVQRSK